MGNKGSKVPDNVDPEVAKHFKKVDKDKSGFIEAKELKKALESGGWKNIQEDSCRIVTRLYDKDGSGKVDIHEFQQLWEHLQTWEKTFKTFDKNNSKSLEASELDSCYKALGYDWGPDFIPGVMWRYGTPDKKITFDHFIVATIDMIRTADDFKTRDKNGDGRIVVNKEEFVRLGMGILF